MKNDSFQLDEFYLDLQYDGHNINPISDKQMEETPFPGLRPFRTSEYPIFFGRDGQADRLIEKLKKNRFLAVLGSSGTGKSSLVRAGMLPQLHGGYLYKAGMNWEIAICRPGSNPIKNLAVALSSIKCESTKSPQILKELPTIEENLLESSYGLLEVSKKIGKKKDKNNLLVIIDQFEELFRYKKESKETNKISLSNHFVNLLIKAVAPKNGNVYVVITMRSEFLGDCVQFNDLPEIINEGQYLIPRLTVEEIEEVIVGPMRTIQKKIAKVLVNRLVDDVGDNMDQLPILQHALMRTYDRWRKDGEKGEMSIDTYHQIGRMEKALANHADDLYKKLYNSKKPGSQQKKQQITEIIFKSLTDQSSDDRGIRRPCKLEIIYGITEELNASKREVDAVINHFRGIDTSFLMPPENVDLYPELVIDIAHESLMRNWELLEDWIKDEVASAQHYKNLYQRRIDNDPFQGGALYDIVKWKKSHPLNGAWALRYHPVKYKDEEIVFHDALFEENIKFLTKSQELDERSVEEEAKRILEEEERKLREKRRKLKYTIVTILFIFFAGLSSFAFLQNRVANQERVRAIEYAARVDSLFAVANLSAQDALINAEESKRNANEASKNAEEASQNAKEAQRQTQIAQENARRAQVSEKRANQNAEENERLRKAAEEEANKYKIILEQRDRAELAKKLVTSLQTESWYRELDQAMIPIVNDLLIEAQNEDSLRLIESFKKAYLADNESNLNVQYYLAKEALSFYDNPVTRNAMNQFLSDKVKFEREFTSDKTIRTLRFLEDGNKFVVGTRDGFYEYSINENTEPILITSIQSDEKPLAISRDGNAMVTYNFGEDWILWYDKDGKQRKIDSDFVADEDPVAKFTRDDDHLILSEKSWLSIYDQAGEFINKIELKYQVAGFYLNPDSKNLLISDLSGNLNNWSFGDEKDGSDQDQKNEYKNFDELKLQAPFGKLEIADLDTYLYSDLRSDRIIVRNDNSIATTFGWHSDLSNVVFDFSPDNQWILSAEDNVVYYWSVTSQPLKEEELVKGGYLDKTAIKDFLKRRGDNYRAKDDYQSAIKDYEKALEYDVNDEGLWRWLSYSYLQNDDYNKILEVIPDGLEIYEDNSTLLNNIGRAYEELGQDDKAIDYYQKAIVSNPDQKVARINLGAAYRRKEDYDQSVSLIKEALKIDPKYVSAWNQLGWTYDEMEKYNQSVDSYKKALEIDPEFKWAWNNLGSTYRDLKKYELARSSYQKALDIDSTYKSAWNGLGNTYSDLKKYEQAKASYQKVLDIDSTYEWPWYNLGNLYSDLEEYELSQSYYLKALELDPDWDAALNNIGWTQNILGNYSEALSNLNKSLDLDPDDAKTIAHRGYNYLKTGRVSEAFNEFTKSQNLDSEYEKIYFYWACYYALQGEEEKAIDNLKIAVEKGFFWSEWAKNEESLNAIRSREEFNELLAAMK